MGNLYPGGSRAKGGRIFSPQAIKRACSSKEYRADGSIADKPHENRREIERRLKRRQRSETDGR